MIGILTDKKNQIPTTHYKIQFSWCYQVHEPWNVYYAILNKSNTNLDTNNFCLHLVWCDHSGYEKRRHNACANQRLLAPFFKCQITKYSSTATAEIFVPNNCLEEDNHKKEWRKRKNVDEINREYFKIEKIRDLQCYNSNRTVELSTMECDKLHYTTLYYTTLHYITLHNITLHYTTLHYTTLHYTTLHYTTLHYTTLHCTPMHNTTQHNTTQHYTTAQNVHWTYVPFSSHWDYEWYWF